MLRHSFLAMMVSFFLMHCAHTPQPEPVLKQTAQVNLILQKKPLQKKSKWVYKGDETISYPAIHRKEYDPLADAYVKDMNQFKDILSDQFVILFDDSAEKYDLTINQNVVRLAYSMQDDSTKSQPNQLGKNVFSLYFYENTPPGNRGDIGDAVAGFECITYSSVSRTNRIQETPAEAIAMLKACALEQISKLFDDQIIVNSALSIRNKYPDILSIIDNKKSDLEDSTDLRKVKIHQTTSISKSSSFQDYKTFELTSRVSQRNQKELILDFKFWVIITYKTDFGSVSDRVFDCNSVGHEKSNPSGTIEERYTYDEAMNEVLLCARQKAQAILDQK